MSRERTGLPAGQWKQYFKKAKVLTDKLEQARGKRSIATLLGNWLMPFVGRPVPIDVNDRRGTATLRMRETGRERLYYFEVQWEKPSN